MKTSKCSQGWRKYLTSSTLILLAAIIVIVFDQISDFKDKIQESNNKLDSIVVVINDEIAVVKTIKKDSIHVYVNQYYIKSDSVFEFNDTTILDSINKQHDELRK